MSIALPLFPGLLAAQPAGQQLFNCRDLDGRDAAPGWWRVEDDPMPPMKGAV